MNWKWTHILEIVAVKLTTEPPPLTRSLQVSPDAKVCFFNPLHRVKLSPLSSACLASDVDEGVPSESKLFLTLNYNGLQLAPVPLVSSEIEAGFEIWCCSKNIEIELSFFFAAAIIFSLCRVRMDLKGDHKSRQKMLGSETLTIGQKSIDTKVLWYC